MVSDAGGSEGHCCRASISEAGPKASGWQAQAIFQERVHQGIWEMDGLSWKMTYSYINCRLLIIIVGLGSSSAQDSFKFGSPSTSGFGNDPFIANKFQKGRSGVPLAHDWHGPLNIHLQLRSSHMTSARLGRKLRWVFITMKLAISGDALCHR